MSGVKSLHWLIDVTELYPVYTIKLARQVYTIYKMAPRNYRYAIQIKKFGICILT